MHTPHSLSNDAKVSDLDSDFCVYKKSKIFTAVGIVRHKYILSLNDAWIHAKI